MASSGIELRGVGYAVAGKAILMGIDLHLSEARIGIVGHSYGGKWALFASCLYDKFACAEIGRAHV